MTEPNKVEPIRLEKSILSPIKLEETKQNTISDERIKENTSKEEPAKVEQIKHITENSCAETEPNQIESMKVEPIRIEDKFKFGDSKIIQDEVYHEELNSMILKMKK